MLFIFCSLYAQDKATCYSIQVKSLVIKEKDTGALKGYPRECKLIYNKKMSSIRCGCFEKYLQAKVYQERSSYKHSLIVSTYSENFFGVTIQKDEDEEELRLLFQVFSFSGDLDNAYITATKALKLYPNSLYWHNKMIDISMWTDRREEAVEHMMYVYKRTHDKKLENKILKYSLAAYQYESAALMIEKKVKEDPSKENVEQMVFIFDLVGKPAESAELLDDVYRSYPSRKYLLTQELQIYLNMGEMQKAGVLVKKMEKAQMDDITSAYLISHYYFLKKNIKASFIALKGADLNNNDGNLTAYYMHLSDLSWYVKEYENAAEASILVDKARQARLIDYERIMSVYKKTRPSLSRKASLDAYEKFEKNYLFYSYAYMGMHDKVYAEVLQECDKVEENSKSTLVNESMYWMIKAQLYAFLHQSKEAKEAFYLAFRISPFSSNILEAYMWFLMEVKDEKSLSKLLFSLEEKENIDSKLWLPMALSYFSIQNVDRAAFFLEKLRKHKLQSIDSELLYAYVRQSQNEEGGFYTQIRVVHNELEMALRRDPSLHLKPDFIQTYLSMSMFLLGADEFKDKLEKSRSILSKESYEELSLAFSLKTNSQEMLKFHVNKMKEVEPWIRLNIALNEADKTGQQDLLYKYYKTLPLSDTLGAAVNTNQASFAQSIAFEGLEKNEKNELLYNQMRELYEAQADYFLMKTGYLDRTGLNQSYSDMHNSYYLAKGYSLEADLFISSNQVNDDEVFKSIPSSSTAFGIGFKKRFERGSYEVSAGMKDSADTYNYLSLKYESQLSRRLQARILVDKAAKAEESVYLLVGGYKDRLALGLDYALLESSRIGVYLEKAQYSSDDGVDLGTGLNGRLDFSYLQRSAYPDISITPYYTFGTYDEKDGSKGVIDDMLNFPDTQVISDDFWYLGVDFSYGMQNRYNYVRVWRPFFSVSPYYNGRESEFNYGFAAGLGGELFGQDNLSLVIDYADSVGGTSDQLLRTYFRYKILY